MPLQGIASPTSLPGAAHISGHQRQVIAQTRIGHAALFVEHPERQPALAEIELPALPAREIHERKLRALRPDQPRFGADRARVSPRVPIARQQQMVAIIDGQVGGRVEIGAAAAAGLLGRLVELHGEAGIGQPHGGREAGNSGADDMDDGRHQMNA